MQEPGNMAGMIPLARAVLDQLRHSRQRPQRGRIAVRLRARHERFGHRFQLRFAQLRLGPGRSLALQAGFTGRFPPLQPGMRRLPSYPQEPRHLTRVLALRKQLGRLQPSFCHRCMIPLRSHDQSQPYVSLLCKPQ